MRCCNLKNNIFWDSEELQLLVLTIIDKINNKELLSPSNSFCMLSQNELIKQSINVIEQPYIILFSLIMRLLLSTINNINENKFQAVMIVYLRN